MVCGVEVRVILLKIMNRLTGLMTLFLRIRNSQTVLFSDLLLILHLDVIIVLGILMLLVILHLIRR